MSAAVAIQTPFVIYAGSSSPLPRGDVSTCRTANISDQPQNA